MTKSTDPMALVYEGDHSFPAVIENFNGVVGSVECPDCEGEGFFAVCSHDLWGEHRCNYCKGKGLIYVGF
jgi:hypothetical protein